jgi:hypothetical protein
MDRLSVVRFSQMIRANPDKHRAVRGARNFSVVIATERGSSRIDFEAPARRVTVGSRFCQEFSERRIALPNSPEKLIATVKRHSRLSYM